MVYMTRSCTKVLMDISGFDRYVVRNRLSSLIILTKKSIRSLEYFEVNLMLGISKNSFSFSSSCCHKKKIPSVYLHQSFKIRSSRSRIKIVAHSGAILVPMVVSHSCSNKDKLCSKILFFNTHLAKSIRGSVDIVFFSLDSKDFLNDIKPS